MFRNERTLLHTDNFAEHPHGFSEFSGPIIDDQVLIRFKNDVPIERQYSILDQSHLIPVGVNLSTRFIQADILDGSHPDIVVTNLQFINEIDHAEVNTINFIDSFPADPAFDEGDPLWEDGINSWGYRRIQAPEAWDFYNDKQLDQIGDIDTSYDTNGKIIMFILDTGYQYHDEFNIDEEDEQFLNLGLNIVNPGTFPADDHGHGVLVTGIAMAEGNNNLGFAGLAWNTRIVPIKTNDYAGQGDEFRSGIGISYAKEVALDYPDYRCVGNMSYGTHSQDHRVDRVNEWAALEDAWKVPNIQFVAAAGNCANHPNPDEGHPCHYHFAVSADNHYPAAFYHVISVAASTGAQSGGYDTEAGFSNWGVSVDVSAPGVEIFSCSKSGPQSFKPHGFGSIRFTLESESIAR
jgi:subtilisin family serine protease